MCLIIAANKSFLNQSYMLTVREPRFYMPMRGSKITILLIAKSRNTSTFHITQSLQRPQNGPSSFIMAFCKNCDSGPVGILAGKKSHQRLAFRLKKKKKKACLCRKFLLFPLCGVWGRVGRRRLFSISVEHCNLK